MPPGLTRDRRNPPASSAAVARSMSANRASRTGPERTLARALWHAGFRGYRLNWKGAPGRPDIAFPGRRVAIFVHGCFWHRCPTCRLPLPKSNREFWKEKFRANRARDRRKSKLLRNEGWKVHEVWECWIQERPLTVPTSLRRSLENPDRR